MIAAIPLWSLALACAGRTLLVQELPVLEARSPTLTIQDGERSREGIWTADPTLALDTYHALRSAEPKTVTFRSDLGSLAFEVEPGKDVDFVVRLADGRDCRTRISMRQVPRRESATAAGEPAVIPFRMEHGWMLVRARVNGSEPLDLMFDTGADNLVLFPSAIEKGAAIELDGSILNAGLGGVATRRTSSDNTLEVAGLTWEHELVLLVEGSNIDCDGILGYVAFEHAVLEIDCERSVMVVHDRAPERVADFARFPARYRGTLFEMEVGIDTGSRTGSGWMVIDSGSAATLHLGRALVAEHSLDELDAIGSSTSRGTGPGVLRNRIVLLPALIFGPHRLENVPAHLEAPDQDASASTGNLLGMEVLERLHTVLDFRRGEVYLRPGARFGEPFAVRRGPPPLVLVGAGIVLLGGCAVLLRRRARRPAV